MAASDAIPGPTGGWLMGNLSEFRQDNLAFYERCKRDFGPMAAFRLGFRRLIMVSDPDLIEEVLVTRNRSFNKHFATRLLRPVLGNGLLLSERTPWLLQRRLIQPAFSRRFIEQFVSIVQLHTSRLAEKWRADPRRDLYHDMTQLTVQIAAHAFLGVSETAETESIGESLETIHADFEYRFQNPWHLPYWIPSAQNRKLRHAVKQLTTIIDRMIETRRNDAEQHFDALSLMLRAEDEDGCRMTTQLLRDEVMTLLLAGHDTTANSLTWTFSLLANHPQIASDLRAERNENDSSSLSSTDTFALKTVKESMRLFPPVYIFGREAIKPVQLGEFKIGRGDTVVMSQWVVHRDEQFYPSANDFSPDRWTPEFERQLPKYAYFPFGGGPRVCIGKEMAMLEAVNVVAMLAREFVIELESVDDLQPWPTVTLRPRNAVWATVSSNGQSTPSITKESKKASPNSEIATL